MKDEPTGTPVGSPPPAAPEAPAAPAPDRPRFARAPADRKALAGVCAGAGRYVGVDPVIFRIVLAVLSLTGGIGLIIYGMGWLVVPQEGERESEAHRLLSGRIEGASLTAALMALVGCGLYASMLGDGTNQAFSFILLAATAGAVHWSQQRRRLREAGDAPSVAASAVVDAPPAVKAPPEPGGAPSWWRDPLAKEPSYLWGPDNGGPDDGGTDRTAWRQRGAAARHERSWLFGPVVLLLAVAAACVGTRACWPYHPLVPSVEIGLASALGVFGAAFLIASFAGRARGGTLFLSLVTLAALIGTATLPKHGHGVGAVTWRPAEAVAVRESYELGGGRGTLDLTAVRLNGGTVTTRLEVAVGKAEVRLPANATVRLDYDLGFGEAALPGRAHRGVDVDRNRRVTYAPPPGTPSAGTINLRVVLGVGQVAVVR
ncbi:PspC domain-containing protein [Streptomyces sp.]|uniref:PspC domain-containing protein n=1 Tax=Streptomyces sp. TaxID=1931 RepID=UPI002F42BD23